MSLNRINHINTILILLSATLAWWAPFELFLGAYALLGPLHYLTEISWLHDRRYFLAHKRESLPLWILSILISLSTFSTFGPMIEKALMALPFSQWQPEPLMFLAVFGSLTLLVFKSLVSRTIASLGVGLAAFFVSESSWSTVILGQLLPTLIHVSAFTFLFMIAGSLKSKSPSGWISVAAYAGCSILLIGLPFSDAQPLTKLATSNPPFIQAIGDILRDLFALPLNNGLRFLAFAYTYHYLNWLSKTKILNWHDMGRTRLYFIIFIYICSVGAYAYDYGFGLRALFFLSFTHVILEFPLNIRTLWSLPLWALGKA